MPGTFLIYGANGYTGELITRYAVESGMKPILAGRNAIAIEELAKKHHLDYRVFSLDETERVDAALQEVDMVLHCAGPFSITSRRMVDACLRNKRHYTDITGEITQVSDGPWPQSIKIHVQGVDWEFLPDPKGRMPDLQGEVAAEFTPQNEGRWRRVGDQRVPSLQCGH